MRPKGIKDFFISARLKNTIKIAMAEYAFKRRMFIAGEFLCGAFKKVQYLGLTTTNEIMVNLKYILQVSLEGNLFVRFDE